MEKRLKYYKYNNSDSVLVIDLHNGFSVIAITGLQHKHDKYNHYLTSFYIKENTVDSWNLMEAFENCTFMVSENKLNSAILKEISKQHYEKNAFQTYFDRYKYELKCFEIGDEIEEQKRLGDIDVS